MTPDSTLTALEWAVWLIPAAAGFAAGSLLTAAAMWWGRVRLRQQRDLLAAQIREYHGVWRDAITAAYPPGHPEHVSRALPPPATPSLPRSDCGNSDDRRVA